MPVCSRSNLVLATFPDGGSLTPYSVSVRTASQASRFVLFLNLQLLYIEHGAHDRQLIDSAKAERDLWFELKQCLARCLTQRCIVRIINGIPQRCGSEPGLMGVDTRLMTSLPLSRPMCGFLISHNQSVSRGHLSRTFQDCYSRAPSALMQAITLDSRTNVTAKL